MPFVRDRFTWLAYIILALFAYLEAAPGPIMPFLREELDLSYTEGGLHFSAFALGLILGSLFTARIADRLGRKPVLAGSGLGMLFAALLFAGAKTMTLTLPGIFCVGMFGAALIIIVQAALIDHHRQHRALALTELNVAASVATTTAPLLVGGLEEAEIGWRGAIYLCAVLIGVMLALMWQTDVPESVPDVAADALKSRLPTAFWIYWTMIFLGVAAEWCVVYWGSDYLDTEIGLNKSTAATLMSVYFVANIVGRLGGSRLTKVIHLDKLLLLATLISAGGFMLFWLAPVAAINIVGLFIAGIGISNLFPLGMAAATGVVAPHQSNLASGRVALAAGIAIFLLPQVMGTMADSIGIKNAYGVVLALLVVIMTILLPMIRTGQQQPSAA